MGSVFFESCFRSSLASREGLIFQQTCYLKAKATTSKSPLAAEDTNRKNRGPIATRATSNPSPPAPFQTECLHKEAKQPGPGGSGGIPFQNECDFLRENSLAYISGTRVQGHRCNLAGGPLPSAGHSARSSFNTEDSSPTDSQVQPDPWPVFPPEPFFMPPSA